jgi:glutathione peroxidase
MLCVVRSLLLIGMVGAFMVVETGQSSAASPLSVTMQTLEGQDVNLAEKYSGKVVLIVNVASKCGLTGQYKQLQALHDKYAADGLAVLGFPCNQFGKQEPGSAEEIASFCEKNYGVQFDMFAKIDVNDATASTLYKTLTSIDTQPVGKGKISWNFEKFLIGRDGQVVARFSPRTRPDDPEVLQAIERELAKK